MSDKPLSKRQRGILDYIRKSIDESGRPPTIREIGAAVDISSTSVVNYNLTKLENKGYVERDADVSRGLRITELAFEEIFGIVDSVQEVVESAMDRIFKIPLLGNIVAGEPIEVGNSDFSTYDEEDAVEISASMMRGNPRDMYALRVSGDSMIDAMVNDGDIVIMQRQTMAQNGEMVAAWLTSDETTTLKYFYHEGSRVRLQPANPMMEPIYVSPKNIQIQGKVMMVLRQTA